MSPLLELRRQFIASLPQRKKVLEQLWRQFAANPSDASSKEALRSYTLRLMGACACFGYQKMSRLLQSVEQSIGGRTPLVPTAVEATLWGLNMLISKAKISPERVIEHKQSSVKPLGDEIVVIEPEEAIRNEIITHLQLFRYTPKIYSSLYDIDDWTKVAVIIADLQSVTEAKENLFHLQDVPFLVTATEGTFEERLQAVQLGADGFFAKPINSAAIIEFLERWIFAAAQEPFRVLLIDDDELVGQFMAEKLRAMDMRVHLLTDASLILEPLQEWQPDVLVMDLASVGIQVATLIRHQQTYLGLPIVFLSSDMSIELQMKTITAGADEFLVKGLHESHLMNVIQHRASRFRKLRAMTERDSLTGLLNHTRIKERLVLEVGRSIRDEEPVSMAMIDIDFFKKVNDTYGHLVGDQVIKALARLMCERFRSTDAVGRYGGEEFAVIMPGATEKNALEKVEELRQQFQQLRFSANNTTFQVTLSAGIAEFNREQDSSQFNNLADQALYLAKNSGRNCIRRASELK